MKKIRNLLAIALAGIMTLGMSATAFAAETESSAPASITAEESTIQPRATYRYLVGADWVTVAYNANGINGDVYLAIDQEGYDGWQYQINMIMTGKNGQVVWSADNITGIYTSGTWHAGSDVARVQIQIKPRSILTPQRSFYVKSIY